MVDVETTGLRANSHRILEIAVVTLDPWGRVLDEWSTRLNPGGPVGASHIHGITAADVADAPRFRDVLSELNARLRGAAIAAHNAAFDLAFLRAEYQRAGWSLPILPVLCTLEASNHHLPHLDRRRLVDCCWAVGVPLVDAHSALADARAAAQLLAAFMDTRRGLPPRPTDLNLLEAAQAVTWPSGPSHQVGAGTLLEPSGTRPAPPPRIQAALAASPVSTPAPALVRLVERFSLIDALDEGAPAGTLAYLEKLAEVLEDGELSDEEAADLVAVAEAHALAGDDVAAANRAFVLALAHEALTDGKVTRAERAELGTVADLLGVQTKHLTGLLDRAEQARHARLSVGLAALPDPWPHGDSLRVGDKVVFTGCDDLLRTELERRSEELGVRVIGSVSAKTAMLVTDGSIDGTKAAKARVLGTRTIHPTLYAVLLNHLQPAVRIVAGTTPAPAVIDQPGEPGALPDAKPVGSDSSASSVRAPSPAVVRRWARDNGFEVGVRGRLPAEVVEAYVSAN